MNTRTVNAREKELLDLFNHLPDVIFVVNRSGKIAVVNSSVHEVLGWEANELIGTSIDDLLPPDARKAHTAQFHNFFTNLSTRKMDERNDLYAWHKKGYPVAVDIKISHCKINNEMHGVAVLRDATIQRQLQRNLEAKNIALKSSNEEKNHCLGVAAHDLRNPIGLVGNFSHIMLEGNIGDLNSTQEEFLKKINKLSEYMLDLLGDLLDISTIESGTLVLQKEKFRFLDLVSDLMFASENYANTKRIWLNISNEVDDEFELYADRRKIQQVFHNLIDNAIKYSESNNTVDIIIKQEQDSLSVLVSDHGVGIPKDDLDNLFKPFYRAKNKPTNKEKSTGLGLYIVKRIIDAHDGTIHVTSKDGKGSNFLVTFPIDREN